MEDDDHRSLSFAIGFFLPVLDRFIPIKLPFGQTLPFAKTPTRFLIVSSK
jgi:hypothetical protein